MKIEQILNKYKDRLVSLNAFIYSRKPAEEMKILSWWMLLNETGDIKKVTKPSARSVDAFFKLFAYPTILIYSLDKNGEIDNTAWIVPDDESSKIKTAYSGAWTREDNRGKLRQYKFIDCFYTFMFEFFDALIGITWQPDLLDLHTKLGYDIVGCIPDYYDHPYCYLLRVTKEKFKNSKFKSVGGK